MCYFRSRVHDHVLLLRFIHVLFVLNSTGIASDVLHSYSMKDSEVCR